MAERALPGDNSDGLSDPRRWIPPVMTTSSPTDVASNKMDLGVRAQTDLLHQAAVGSLIWLRSVWFGAVRCH
eukprot:scaffold287532_cov35-Attheya_sp.AAC.1